MMVARVVCPAAAGRREDVIECLQRGFGGLEGRFQAAAWLWLADELAGQRRAELELEFLLFLGAGGSLTRRSGSCRGRWP